MSKKTTPTNGQLSRPLTPLRLDQLHFDVRNPRYGPRARRFKHESEVVDEIVGSFGVEDLLSSMAVNGYFASEPMVGIREQKDGPVRIMEGNRRLAACLILAGDARAKNQERRTRRYSVLRKEHGSKPIEPVPVMVFEGRNAERELLPYLGIRHIVGSLPWDSFAKAAWVARVVAQKGSGLTLEDVIQMIGDNQRTAERILSSYYLVEQLIDNRKFDPGDAVRKGKGSQAEFPFSLVYNALGFSSIKKWIGMPDGRKALNAQPLKGDLENAEWLMHFLFGSQKMDFAPVIKDSRDLRVLANAVSKQSSANALKRGATLTQVAQESLPDSERVESGLMESRELLEDVLGVVGRGSLNVSNATQLLPTSREVRALAGEIAENLAQLSIGNAPASK